jgi:hypothetical protein
MNTFTNIIKDIWVNFKYTFSYILKDILYPKRYFPEYYDTDSEEDSEPETESEPQKDNRLFKGEQLYCEGRIRTSYRGKFHLVANMTIFPYFIYIYNSQPLDLFAYKVGITNLLILYSAHIVSSIYHIFDFSIQNEIFMQKLDHTFLNLYIGSSYYPMALLLLPKHTGELLLLFLSLIMYKNCLDIWSSKYSIYRSSLLVLLEFPFLTNIATYFTNYELICNFIAIGAIFCGGYFIINELSPSCYNTKTFGFFDIYHSFSIICTIAIFSMNYSIVTRYPIICIE